MPRDIPVGNGSLLVTFDAEYRIRDFYYPHVGKENQTLGFPCRFGIWADGRFSWMGAEWSPVLRYEPDTLVTAVAGRHDGLGVELVCNDVVDFHEPIYLRRLGIRNRRDRAQEIRLFFHHDFNIAESDVGDTALWDPHLECLLHYKGPRYFLVGMLTPQGPGVKTYAIGVKRIQGREGTWRDAEDGILGGNPIAQGSVDSVGGLSVTVEAGGEEVVYYWIAAGPSYRDVQALYSLLTERTPQRLLERTRDYWRLWVRAPALDLSPLPREVADLYQRSLLVLRTQVDNNGAIVAANDSDVLQFNRDSYSYVWPRDGALVAHALDRAGYLELSKRFYFFCKEVIHEEGFFLHKYNPDGSAGSSWHPWGGNKRPYRAIQEDETALVLWALWHHYLRYRNTEFIKPLYRPLIAKAGDFMEKYRDQETGLPRPSYDLWEERPGVLTFTCAAVHAGLEAAARFARAFGEQKRAAAYFRACREIKAGMDRHLYQEDLGRFPRMLSPEDHGGAVDPTLDASVYALFAFGVYDPWDERVVRTMRAVEERLSVPTAVGGIARYQNDLYQRGNVGPEIPGNPWFVCTLWLAQYFIACARSPEELERALRIFEWVAQRALPSGVLAEQVDPYTGRALSVSPLTWSHAGFVIAVTEYLEMVAHFQSCPTCGHARPLSRMEQALPGADAAETDAPRP